MYLPRSVYATIFLLYSKGSLFGVPSKVLLPWVLRWIFEILHDPDTPKSQELWYCSILRSCRILSINSLGTDNGAWRSGYHDCTCMVLKAPVLLAQQIQTLLSPRPYRLNPIQTNLKFLQEMHPKGPLPPTGFRV